MLQKKKTLQLAIKWFLYHNVWNIYIPVNWWNNNPEIFVKQRLASTSTKLIHERCLCGKPQLRLRIMEQWVVFCCAGTYDLECAWCVCCVLCFVVVARITRCVCCVLLCCCVVFCWGGTYDLECACCSGVCVCCVLLWCVATVYCNCMCVAAVCFYIILIFVVST